jgi:hypothetical protein
LLQDDPVIVTLVHTHDIHMQSHYTHTHTHYTHPLFSGEAGRPGQDGNPGTVIHVYLH